MTLVQFVGVDRTLVYSICAVHNGVSLDIGLVNVLRILGSNLVWIYLHVHFQNPSQLLGQDIFFFSSE